MTLKVFICLFCFPFITCAQFKPMFRENFESEESLFFDYMTHGEKLPFKYRQGEYSSFASNKKVLKLTLHKEDKVGPRQGPQIISKNITHFGTYSARLKIPKVDDLQPNVGALVGLFTYNETPNGLSEIDFEWHLTDPTLLYIGTYTGKGKKLKRVERIIKLDTGELLNTEIAVNEKPVIKELKVSQTTPNNILPIDNYDASSEFYTYGFDWMPERIVWWVLHPVSNEKIILWDYAEESEGIPQDESRFRANIWHSDKFISISNPKASEKPEHNFSLEVDWMEFVPFEIE
jgi:hypothetical protein